MVPSFCASALLVLAAVVKGSEDATNGAMENLVKRAPHMSHGHLIKRAENGKFARRHGGGYGSMGGLGNSVNSFGNGAYGASQLGGLDVDGDGGFGGFGNGIGGGIGGMSQSSQYSSVTQTQSSTINSVMSGYSRLLSSIQSYESIVIAGQISAEIAMQQAQQLALQFQTVISQFQACTACLGGGISSFQHVFSSLFQSFSSLVTNYQTVLPGSWQRIFGSSFGSLSGSFSNLFSICQGAGLGVNNFLPSPMLNFFQSAGMTEVTHQLRQFGMSF